jgi:microsomal epoxide hydrolase
MANFDAELSGYMKLQATRPQTLSYALTDSPVGQLAWIVEKFWEWTDSATAPEDAVDRDLLLTLVTTYWLTRTAGSSAQLYYEDGRVRKIGTVAGEQPALTVPIGVAVFPHDILLPIRKLADRDLPGAIKHWTEFDRGGHFAALEQPESLVADIRTFARSLQPVGAS